MSNPASGRASWRTVLAYGPPAIGMGVPLFLVQFYFLKYATDDLLLGPALIGTLFMLGRVWDAVSDPIAGLLSDRTRSRLGRRRPWMLAGAPLVGISFVLLFNPPADWVGTPLLVWVAVSLFAFYTGFTLYVVPHQALGAELTGDHHDRSRLYGFRQVAFFVGMFAAFGGMQYAMNADDGRAAVARLSMAEVGLIVGVLLIPPLLLRERASGTTGPSSRPFQALGAVARNPHARLMLSAQFIDSLGVGALGVMTPYVAEYVVKRPDLVGPLSGVAVIVAVTMVPFWVVLSRRMGKRNAWISSSLITSTGFGLMYFVGENEVGKMTVFLVIAGLGMGAGGALAPSVLADIADHDEYHHGVRREGAFFSASSFMFKTGSAAIVFLAGVVLEYAGFVPNVDQVPGTILAMRVLYAVFPCAMLLIGALLLSRIAYGEAEHRLIREALDARALGVATSDGDSHSDSDRPSMSASAGSPR